MRARLAVEHLLPPVVGFQFCFILDIGIARDSRRTGYPKDLRLREDENPAHDPRLTNKLRLFCFPSFHKEPGLFLAGSSPPWNRVFLFARLTWVSFNDVADKVLDHSFVELSFFRQFLFHSLATWR